MPFNPGRGREYASQYSEREAKKAKREKERLMERKLDKMVLETTKKLRKDFVEYEGGDNLLEDDGTLRKESFLRSSDNPEGITKKELKDDKKFIEKRKAQFADLLEKDGKTPVESVQEHYKDNFGCKNLSEMIEKFEGRRENKPGFLLEKAVFVLFNKVLGKDYMFIKASDFDDIDNGMDFILMGEDRIIACGFDGVIKGNNEKDYNDKKRGDRYEKKMKRIRSKAKTEGAKLKYGIDVEETEEGGKKIVKKEITHMPTVCLRLGDYDLNKLIEKMYENMGIVSDTEFEMFDKIMMGVNRQLINIKRNKGGVNKKVNSNYAKFWRELPEIEEVRWQKKEEQDKKIKIK
jgi:hypothetical protein